ncbi:MAG: PTS sugar transporter subunit IIA [Candidatus Saelkia tenebricola]|nr:PTS sugar transporter subunit IIA [Candidatus Saelkia tenebricola]
MNISDILKLNTLKLNLAAKDKEEVMDEMLDILIKAKKLNSKYKKKVKKALMDRESLGSTGIGQNIGIPHAKDDSIKKIVSCCAISQEGVDFDALDGEPVYVFFMILAPRNATGEHLKALAKISRLIRDKFFRASLMRCKTPKELLAILKREEEELK